MSSGGGKVSYVLTLQHGSAPLTSDLMASVQLRVDEIVYTLDNAFMYVYIHCQRKTRKDELEKGILDLLSSGVVGTNIFGYNAIDGTSLESSEFIEDHPGFMTLVKHQADENVNFRRWTAPGYREAISGYNVLKNKLLAKRAQSAGGGSGGASVSEEGMGRRAADDNDEEEETNDGERSKRQRTRSPRGGQNMLSAEAVANMISSAIASSVSSSGSAVTSASKEEQRRREHAEQRVREMEMERTLCDERLRIEREIAKKYEAKLHDAELECRKTDEELQAAKLARQAAEKESDELRRDKDAVCERVRLDAMESSKLWHDVVIKALGDKHVDAVKAKETEIQANNSKHLEEMKSKEEEHLKAMHLKDMDHQKVLDDKSAEVSIALSALKDVEKELSDVRLAKDALEKEVNANMQGMFKDKNEKFAAELAAKEAEVTELGKQLTTKEEEHAAVIKAKEFRVCHLTDQIATNEAEIQRLNAELATLGAAGGIGGLQEEMKAKDLVVCSLTDQIAAKDVEIQRLTADLATLGAAGGVEGLLKDANDAHSLELIGLRDWHAKEVEARSMVLSKTRNELGALKQLMAENDAAVVLERALAAEVAVLALQKTVDEKKQLLRDMRHGLDTERYRVMCCSFAFKGVDIQREILKCVIAGVRTGVLEGDIKYCVMDLSRGRGRYEWHLPEIMKQYNAAVGEDKQVKLVTLSKYPTVMNAWDYDCSPIAVKLQEDLANRPPTFQEWRN